MPPRKKKFLKRKKKTADSTPTKRDGQQTTASGAGGVAIEKKPCFTCKVKPLPTKKPHALTLLDITTQQCPKVMRPLSMATHIQSVSTRKENKLLKLKCFTEYQWNLIIGPTIDKDMIYTNNKTDKGGVKRILSPFNRFANNTIRIPDQNKIALTVNVPYRSIDRPTGLSPKERSYLINSCESKGARYKKLKGFVADAIKQNKVFTIYGCCNPVRNALLDRGWIEKIPSYRMNLSRLRNSSLSSDIDIQGELEKLLLSNLVEKCSPNLIWRCKEALRDYHTTIDRSNEYTALVNKLKIDAIWTSKQGLCYSMKRNYWFYIEDMAEVIGPRTYNAYDVGEIEGFVKDYKITACTSLLKWILSMVDNERPVFIETGNISINVVVFALNRCREYLIRKQNKDIDKTLNNVSSGQWNAFLKKYYRVIAKDDVFRADVNNKVPLYLVYAKILLKEMYRYRPQLSCEGCHNIWIIKPANNSRGRGIRLASNLGVITSLLNKVNVKYVIQKYIEEPLLIYDTKFDIRQYYLVTSTFPLEIWMYRDCYLKFSSQRYSLRNYHESIHLTNNAVQRNYANCAGRHSELPRNNMWDLDKYKNYLRNIGKSEVWENIIYPGMRKSIVGIMLSCQDNLSVCKNRFELYGCDFILDKDFKPWLIEINSCPDLNHTTPVTARICPAVLSDIIKVVVDHARDRRSSTGKFECIYRQPLSIPRYGAEGELFVRGYALPDAYFYRGKIKVKESYDADIGKECNIKYILNKLKQFYDKYKMELEDEDLRKKIEQETSTCKSYSTELGNDMPSTGATASSEQMEELDRISSEHSVDSSSKSKLNSETFQPSNRVSHMQYVKSETEISSLISYNRFASTDGLKQFFSFSKLDDGPLGTGSYVDLKKKYFQI